MSVKLLLKQKTIYNMVTSMLEKAIEIEGLLRIIRDGNPLPETYSLLRAKTTELATMAADQGEQTEDNRDKDNQQKDFVMEDPGENSIKGEVIFDGEELVAKEETVMTPIIEESTITEAGADETGQEDLAMNEEDDILLSFDDMAEDDAATPEEEEPSDKPDRQEAPSRPKQTKLKSTFSLNDRFLYARELFGGNIKLFDTTLEYIEGAKDFPAIEEYFYTELEWDSENSNVASFMEKLRPYFDV